MTLAFDASATAPVYFTTPANVTPITSPSISTAIGTRFFIFPGSTDLTAHVTYTITDTPASGASLTWSKLSGNTTETAECWVSSPTLSAVSRTITVARDLNPGPFGVAVIALAGCDTTTPGIGNNGGTSTSTNFNAAAATTTVNGSWVFGIFIDDVGSNTLTSSDLGATYGSGNTDKMLVYKSAPTPASGTAVTLNLQSSGPPALRWASVEILPAVAASAPDAPAAPTASAQHDAVGFTLAAAPANNGAPITGYIWETAPSPYTSWSTVSGVTTQAGGYATGLTPGTSYKVRVTATNSVGNSTASSASPAVTAVDLTGLLQLEDGTFLLLEDSTALQTQV